MSYRNGNYTAFYVAEPFSESNFGVHATPDFKTYNLFRAWKESKKLPFIDSHSKNYNVRDNSDWEKTLKPRLHERLRNSKNIILILSSNTKNSRALREEINYGINNLGLPIIVVYPEFSEKTDIASNNHINKNIKDLWDKVPVFRDSMHKVPTIHIPLKCDLLKNALGDKEFMVQSKETTDKYFYK